MTKVVPSQVRSRDLPDLQLRRALPGQAEAKARLVKTIREVDNDITHWIISGEAGNEEAASRLTELRTLRAQHVAALLKITR